MQEKTSKKTILINSDYPILKTGLARQNRELANYLYNSGKYNVVYYCCGTPWDAPEYQRFPYKVVGALPNDPAEMNKINSNPIMQRDAAYGLYNIDRAIREFRPDVLITSNDSWASQNYTSKPWWNKVHCLAHITLDSLPFLPDQINYIKNTPNFFVWADFAEKEAHRLGFPHVKLLAGMINDKNFHKLPKHEKLALRGKFGLPSDAFITGFVFRNQLRKEVKPLLEGFKTFCKDNPKTKSYLLLHTNYSEGNPNGSWDIPRLIQELEIDNNKILTSYICKACNQYQIKPFAGQDLDCPYCSNQRSCCTINVTHGASEKQLNEVYNLLDVYYQGFTNGGLEYPILEAMLCELPVLTVPFTCGEMFTTQPNVYSIDYTTTIQVGTQFKRAVLNPFSIAKNLNKVFNLPAEEKDRKGKLSRLFILNNFSIQVLGKKWEDIIDVLPDINYDYEFTPRPKNPNAVIPNIENNHDWIITLYKEILDMAVDKEDSGFKSWESNLKNGAARSQIEQYFRKVAQEENQKNTKVDFKDILIKNNKKGLLIVLKESAGDIVLSTSLLESFRNNHPAGEWNIYFATSPQYFDILDGNSNVDKVIHYQDFMESEIACTGQWTNKGYFDAYIHLAAGCQRVLNYLTLDNIRLPKKKYDAYEKTVFSNSESLIGIYGDGLNDNYVDTSVERI